MFPIGSEIPRDTASFCAALTRGLAPLGVPGDSIDIQGEFPQFAYLGINLSETRFHRGLEISRSGGELSPLCFARAVRIHGEPVYAGNVPMQVDLQAEDVVIAAAPAKSGDGKVMVLERAGNGSVDLSVAKADLETALLSLGRKAAEDKGAEIKNLDLQLRSESPRSLSARASIEGKALFFTASVTLSGSLEVDDELNARVRDLRCEGEGMIGKMATGALSAHIDRIQARVFPLGQAFAGLRLRDVRLEATDRLRIHASFGGV